MLAVVITIVLILLVLYLYIAHDPNADLPGAYGHPLLGSLPKLTEYIKNQNVNQFFEETVKGHKIAKFRALFGETAFIVNDASVAKHLVSDSQKMPRSPMPQFTVQDYMEYALFVIPGGDVWKKHRKLLQPGFGPIHLNHAFESAKQSTLLMVENLRSKSTIDVHGCLDALALDVLGQVAFGYDMKSLLSFFAGRHSEFEEIVSEATLLFNVRFGMPQVHWYLNGNQTNGPKTKKIVDFFKRTTEPIIAQRKKQMETAPQKDWDMDFLQRLLNASGELTEREIIGELIGFFIAGHETTSNTLTSAIYALCLHPELQDKLFDEVKNVQDLTADKLGNFRFLDAFIKETQRFYTTVPAFDRVITEETEFLGRKYKKNSRFLISTYSLHMNPEYWKDPQTFDPSRFEKQVVPGSFMPFGDGPQSCIGQKMAVIEMKVVLIYLIKNFSMKLIPNQEIKWVYSITRGLKNGLQIDFQPRY